MLNQIVLVGRLVRDLEVKELENKKVANVTIAVPRPYKNAEGVYDTDFVDVILFDSIANNTSEYCRKGDLLGIKGRVQTRKTINEDGTENKIQEIIAEKVTFLSSRKADEEEQKDS